MGSNMIDPSMYPLYGAILVASLYVAYRLEKPLARILWPNHSYCLSKLFSFEKYYQFNYVKPMRYRWLLDIPLKRRSWFEDPKNYYVDPKEYDPKGILNSKITHNDFDYYEVIKNLEVPLSFYPNPDGFIYEDNLIGDKSIKLKMYADLEYDAILRESFNLIQYTIFRCSRGWVCEDQFIIKTREFLDKHFEHYKLQNKLSGRTIRRHKKNMLEYERLVAEMLHRRECFINHISSYLRKVISMEFNKSYYCKNLYENADLDEFFTKVIHACINYQLSRDLDSGTIAGSPHYPIHTDYVPDSNKCPMQYAYIARPLAIPDPPAITDYDLCGIKDIKEPITGSILNQYFVRFDGYCSPIRHLSSNKHERIFEPNIFYSERQAWISGKIINPYYDLDFIESCLKKNCELFDRIVYNIGDDLYGIDEELFRKSCNERSLYFFTLRNCYYKTFDHFIRESYYSRSTKNDLILIYDDLWVWSVELLQKNFVNRTNRVINHWSDYSFIDWIEFFMK